jgi:hypothetical protein
MHHPSRLIGSWPGQPVRVHQNSTTGPIRPISHHHMLRVASAHDTRLRQSMLQAELVCQIRTMDSSNIRQDHLVSCKLAENRSTEARENYELMSDHCLPISAFLYIVILAIMTPAVAVGLYESTAYPRSSCKKQGTLYGFRREQKRNES